jgi:hypothetical protein
MVPDPIGVGSIVIAMTTLTTELQKLVILRQRIG